MSSQQFGKLVKKAREEVGLTQEALAKKMDVHPSYISRVERGVIKNPTKDMLESLGKILKLKASELLSI